MPPSNKRRTRIYVEYIRYFRGGGGNGAVYQCGTLLTASPRKSRPGGTPRSRSNSHNGHSGPEDEDDEDIHSDDEFNFIDDVKDPQPAPALPNQPVTEFGVTLDGQNPLDQITEGSPAPSGPGSKPAEGIGGDAFVRMMADFKGFGSSSSSKLPPAPPPKPKPVPDLNLDGGGSDVAKSHVTGSEYTGGDNTGSVEGASARHDDSTVVSDRYKGIDESAAGSSYQGLVQQGESPSLNSNNTLASSVSSTPEYIKVLSPDDQEPKTPDSVDMSIIRDDSFSVFTPRATKTADQVTQQPPQDDAVAKLENLKPRLKYPVLLVTAGEGHADLRRKVPDGNEKEPRVMIWQMS